MGITGLLPLLDKSTRNCNVSEFRGCTVAIDTYCWLHRGARGCAMELATNKKTDSYVIYCMKIVQMLLSHNIKPIMVFDGSNLPAKQKTEEKRRESKKVAKKKAIEFLNLGKVPQADKYFQQCIDIDPSMALEVVAACRQLGVDCIVAPFEADAQLAFFSLESIADVIISEDSDLLVYGCKKVLFKMNLLGDGQLVELDKINLSLQMRGDSYTFDKFMYMCILSGCDYLDSLPGIGLKTALKFLKMTAETNPELFLTKIPSYLNKRNLNAFTETYKKDFMRALATFRHQVVYNPFSRMRQNLTPASEMDLPYCENVGDFCDNDKAYQLALGNIHPTTNEVVDCWSPSKSKKPLRNNSIWNPKYTKKTFFQLPVITPSSSPAFIGFPKEHVQSRVSFSTPSNSPAFIGFPEEKEDDGEIDVAAEFQKTIEYYKNIGNNNEPSTSKLVLEEPQSPIISRRHFIPFQKRKISKFQLTDTSPENSEKKEVKSRFFVEDHANNNAENQSITSSTDTTPVECECECVLDEGQDVLVFEDAPDSPEDEPKLSSIENLLEPAQKRRKISVGQSNIPTAKKQMKITDMFNRMNTHNK